MGFISHLTHALVMWRSTPRLRSLYQKNKTSHIEALYRSLIRFAKSMWSMTSEASFTWKPHCFSICFSICFKRNEPQQHSLIKLSWDITHQFSIMGTTPLQPFLKSYWLTPVQMTGQLSRSMQIMTSSRQYKCGARDNYVRTFSFTCWTT